MALSDAQRADVRLYLGWPARFLQTDSALELAMRALETTPESEALVTSLLASLADVDVKLEAAHARLKAAKVGSIELNGAELVQLRGEGRRFAGRLAALLGVEIRVDVFSGNPSTHRSSWAGPVGGSNYQMHG